MVVTNRGPRVQSSVRIVDQLPAGTTFISAQTSRGTVGHTNGVVTHQIGLLTNATAVSLSIVVSVQAEGVLTNTATVTAAETDSDPGNNVARAVTTVSGEASRVLSIQRAPQDQIVLSWPASPVPFTLEARGSFAPGTVWTNVPIQPVLIGGRNVVTNQASGAARFYRLRR
jgi:hypothetical protein